MKFLTTLGLVLLLSPPAFAFINIEALRRSPHEGLRGSVNLQGNGQSGNSDTLVGEFSSFNLYRIDRKESLLMANYKYGESRGIRDVHLGSLHGRFSQGWENFPPTEVFGQGEFDQFTLLKERYLLGTGFRFQIASGSRGNSFAGVGVFHEWEQINLPNSSQEDWRWNFYLSRLIDLNEIWMLSAIVYYQPTFEDTQDYRLRANLGLESKITKLLSLTMTYSHQFDNEPPPTVKKQDISYMVGLSLKFEDLKP